MAEKTLRTRIALLYKTYAEWDNIKSTYVPLKGEVCFCEVPVSTGAVAQEPCMLFKVGDGVKTFENLPWVSALAADVYAWAKKENLEFNDLSEAFIAALDEHISGKVEDTNTRYQFRKLDNGNYQLQSKELNGDWADVAGQVIEIPQFDPTAIIARIEALEAGKVDKAIEGTNGDAYIFNEADGGGAKFVHNDGSEAFVGVNDGGEEGLMAQIYADINEDGQWVGSRINVYHKGIYYVSKAAQLAGASRDEADREIATLADIKALGKVLRFRGIFDSLDEVTNPEPGDVAIVGEKEFIYVSEGAGLAFWKEFGDVSLYATKAELEAEIARAKAEEAKKVDRELQGDIAKSLIFNEKDGGGAKLEGPNNTAAYVGTHDNINGKLGAQIYADKNANESTIIDVTEAGAFYTKGTILPSAQRDVEANEIATKGVVDIKINEKVGELADIAHTGNVNDLVQTNGDVLILNCNI